MKLSVVIPAYNNLIEVLTCLNSLRALQVGDVEYVVQDDASPSVHLPMLIPEEIASVQRNDNNVGFGVNANTGAARASGDVVLFCNQDVFGWAGWSNGWDTALLNAFSDPGVGIVGARLLFPDLRIQSAGGLFDGHKQPFHRCLGYSNPHHPDVSQPREVSWVTGAALAVRRELFYKLGGFDAAYVSGYFEDVDLCLKVRQAGYKIWYEPRCTLFHKVGTSGGNPNFLRNAMTFKQRWVDTGKVKQDSYVVSERFW